MPMPDDDPPDFSGKQRGVTLNWEINIPTMLYAIVLFGGGVVAYSNFQVDRNDVKWEQKVQAADIDALKRGQESNITAMKALADSLSNINQTVHHLTDVMEWNQAHPQKP